MMLVTIHTIHPTSVNEKLRKKFPTFTNKDTDIHPINTSSLNVCTLLHAIATTNKIKYIINNITPRVEIILCLPPY